MKSDVQTQDIMLNMRGTAGSLIANPEDKLMARSWINTPMATVVSAIVLAMVGMGSAHAGSFKTLYEFAGGTDGANPAGDLTMLNGELYGTTSSGGLAYGVIFAIDPDSGSEKVIHALSNDTEGGVPYAGLLAAHSKLYGTASQGGNYGYGSVFEVDPATGDTTLIHSFNGSTGSDGANPYAAVIEYRGHLYGTTAGGGNIGNGTVFTIDLAFNHEYLIKSLDDASGSQPLGRLLEKGGMLYGTCSFPNGTIFELNLTTGEYDVLWNFSAEEGGIQAPAAGLIVNSNTLYGTTIAGGHDNRGTVYRLKLSNAKFRPVYEFHDSKHDGDYSTSDLVLVNGTVYGTTTKGGKAHKGTVFGVNIATTTETILHEFTGGKDGGDPVAGLMFYNGALYGTTFSGAHGYGTVFKVTP